MTPGRHEASRRRVAWIAFAASVALHAIVLPEWTLESVDFRAISDRDVQRAIALDEEYVGIGEDNLTESRAQHPDWLRGAYLGDELVGICCGSERPVGAVVLQSIAVMFKYWRNGIGSRLIQDFERTVFADGITKISLGSAADRPTESFYLKNGYRATHVMLSVARDVVRARADRGLPEPVKVVDDGHERRLSFPIDGYAPETRDELKASFAAREGIFIFEKTSCPAD